MGNSSISSSPPRWTLFATLLILSAATLALGADGTAAKFGACGAASLLAARLLATGRLMGLPRDVAASFLIALAILTAIEASQGRFVSAAPELASLIAAAAFFVVGSALSQRRPQRKAAIRAVTLVLLAITVISFVDFAVSPAERFGFDKPYHDNRMSAPFLSANTAATFYGLVSLWAIGQWLAIWRRANRKGLGWTHTLSDGGGLPAITLIFSLTSLVLTGSRAGIVLAGVSMLALIGMSVGVDHLRRHKLWAGGCAVVAGLALLALVGGEIIASRFADDAFGATGRGPLWSACLAAIADRPWMGWGLDGFDQALAAQMTRENAASLILQGAAHNVILQWLMQIGVIGTLAMAVPIVLLFRHLGSAARRHTENRTQIRLVVVMGSFVFLHGQLDYALEIPAILWWVAFFLGWGQGASVASRGCGIPKRNLLTIGRSRFDSDRFCDCNHSR